MEIQKFLKWWWTEQLTSVDRVGFSVLGGGFSFLGLALLSGFFFGPQAMFITVISMLTLFLLGLTVFLIRNQWKQYIPQGKRSTGYY